MKKNLLRFLLALSVVPLITAQTAKAECALIISEYIEGSSNNKALELYNGTSSSIDLAAGNYVFQFYFNGASTPGTTISLTGTVAASATYVVAISSASTGITVNAQQLTGGTYYNGDDAIVLRSGGGGGTILDSIGQVGVDPGTNWVNNGVSTVDHTLRRKSSVLAGDTTPTDAFDPSIEWDSYPQDTFDGLGSHVMDCPTGTVPDPLLSLTATAVSVSAIDVSWEPNAATNPVMVAWATNNVFGLPSGSYVATDPISGGGEVLYVGSATSVTHSSLSDNVTYYYRAWSVVGGTNYSTVVVNANATTPSLLPPSITITNPPLASNDVSSGTATVDLQGTGVNLAGDGTWVNNNGGGNGTFTAGVTWEALAIPLNVGANPIVVTATNIYGATASATTLVVRMPQTSPANADVWINEIHYDNALADVDEGIEIAGPAGTDLSDYSLVLYNGGNNLQYSSNALSGTIPNEGCGYGVIWFAYPANGIQNGSPDGLALIKAGTSVVQFLSYEGPMLAGNGPAAGYMSIDIGVNETGEVAGLSLQLTGSGTNYADFTWTGPVANSTGTLNGAAGQTISPCNGGDGDELPDDWELQNFGSLTNAPTGDNDGDGFDNLSEFIAGTQPTNGLSYLKLVDLVNSNVTGRAIVFESVTGRVYSVDVLTELPLGNWSNLLNGVPGTGGALNIDDAADATNRHYRLGVQIAP